MRELVDEQNRLLEVLPDATGQPAFDLPGGAELLQRLLGTGFPHAGASSLLHMVVLALQTPFTQGDQHRVVAMVPGTQPFPETLVRRFLAGYQGETSQPEEACSCPQSLRPTPC